MRPRQINMTSAGGASAAEDVTYDNGASGLTATDVQEAIDELAASSGSGGTAISGTVTTYADLPAAADHEDELYAVTTASGTIFINRKAAGVYRSDGASWIYVSTLSEHDQASEVSTDQTGWTDISGATVQAALDSVDDALDNRYTKSEIDAQMAFAGGFGITIDGAGSAITTGVKGFITIPFDCTITGWDIVADQSGSIVIDVWKDTYANFPPTVADTIAGTEKPTLSSAQKNQDTSLSSWTTTVTAGDVIGFSVDSATTVTRVTLTVRTTRS